MASSPVSLSLALSFSSALTFILAFRIKLHSASSLSLYLATIFLLVSSPLAENSARMRSIAFSASALTPNSVPNCSMVRRFCQLWIDQMYVRTGSLLCYPSKWRRRDAPNDFLTHSE
jgi:hypothetical protein